MTFPPLIHYQASAWKQMCLLKHKNLSIKQRLGSAAYSIFYPSDYSVCAEVSSWCASAWRVTSGKATQPDEFLPKGILLLAVALQAVRLLESQAHKNKMMIPKIWHVNIIVTVVTCITEYSRCSRNFQQQSTFGPCWCYLLLFLRVE